MALIGSVLAVAAVATPASSATGPQAYVTNASSDNVSVISTATNSVTATVPVGDSPTGVAVTPDGTKAYVTNVGSDTVSVISTATNTVTATVTVGESPLFAAVTPDGAKVYVTNGGSDDVSVISTATNTVTATIPIGVSPTDVEVTPDGANVYVTSNLADSVKVISTATNTVTATITVGDFPQGVAVTPNGTKVYVINVGSDTVSVISTATNTVTATITINGPEGVAVTPDGTKAYVTNGSSDAVSVISTATNIVIATVAVGDSPLGVAVTRDGTTAYVNNVGSDNVSVISTATNMVTSTVAVGGAPNDVAIAVVPPPPTSTSTTLAGTTTTIAGGTTTTSSTVPTATTSTTTAPSETQATLSDSSVKPGETVTVSGGGFAPNQPLKATLLSDPLPLGTTQSDATGAFQMTVTIPLAATPGDHRIVVSGPGAQGGELRSAAAITVQPAATTPPPDPGPAPTASASATDPTGDNGPGLDPSGDLVRVGADYGSSVVLSATVATPTDPRSDPNWLSTTTTTVVGWFIDTNGDEVADYFAGLTSIPENPLFSEVLKVTDGALADTLCTATGSFSSGQLKTTFDPSCIGNPKSFQMGVVMIYETPTTSSIDLAPDSSLCCLVTQALAGPTTSIPPGPGATGTLPRTGSGPLPLTLFSLALIVSGATLNRRERRRRELEAFRVSVFGDG